MALDPSQLAKLAALSDDDLAAEPRQTGDDHARTSAVEADVWDVIAARTAEECGRDAGELAAQMRLIDDLDLDDLGRYAIVTQVEHDLKIHLPDAECDAAQTLGDIAEAAAERLD
ncbi:MAG: phosphopantetheine-binding protein [Actinomycetaceae bacterium]|nr:phosphopantetheine-binding protein [Actinomycetaceae bacterium]MDU0970157.1 phosphopantetheine-binding protein [Actinomycetaceae bacterium]